MSTNACLLDTLPPGRGLTGRPAALQLDEQGADPAPHLEHHGVAAWSPPPAAWSAARPRRSSTATPSISSSRSPSASWPSAAQPPSRTASTSTPRSPFLPGLLRLIRRADVAHPELEVRILVLLHLARQARRLRPASRPPSAPCHRARHASWALLPILYCRIIVAKRSSSDGCDASIGLSSIAVIDVADAKARGRRRLAEHAGDAHAGAAGQAEPFGERGASRPAPIPESRPCAFRGPDPRGPARPISSTVSIRCRPRSNATRTETGSFCPLVRCSTNVVSASTFSTGFHRSR